MPEIKKINNNENLKNDVLNIMKRDIENNKIGQTLKQLECRSSIQFFLKEEINHIKIADPCYLDKKRKLNLRWDAIRSAFRLRVLWRRLIKKSYKARSQSDMKPKFEPNKTLAAFDKGLDNCILQGTLYGKGKREIEAVVMNRRIELESRYDFVENIDKIIQPKYNRSLNHFK